ncbi:hypothetical protein [Methanolacinia paynteri]|uniref:hypothetical protein n=1 Tax=Methanolacinia paynteri TaxID=230356 RepID=UPI00064FB174|nr:hypothetical protein [Methanolacinia paynteri]
MEQIIDARKSFNGIQVTYATDEEIGNAGTELFSYENLIDMRINALDLLDNPLFYSFDPIGPRIVKTVE